MNTAERVMILDLLVDAAKVDARLSDVVAILAEARARLQNIAERMHALTSTPDL